MSENSSQAIWLTQEAYDKLRNELDHLSGPGRAAMAQKIAQAREEGDLRENGGYHAARDEQGQQEARIRQLSDMLGRAQVGEAPAAAGEVAPGTRVTIAFDGDVSDTDTFVLAHASCSDWTRASIRPTSTARNPPSELPFWGSAKGTRCPTLHPTAARSMSR